MTGQNRAQALVAGRAQRLGLARTSSGGSRMPKHTLGIEATPIVGHVFLVDRHRLARHWLRLGVSPGASRCGSGETRIAQYPGRGTRSPANRSEHGGPETARPPASFPGSRTRSRLSMTPRVSSLLAQSVPRPRVLDNTNSRRPLIVPGPSTSARRKSDPGGVISPSGGVEPQRLKPRIKPWPEPVHCPQIGPWAVKVTDVLAR